MPWRPFTPSSTSSPASGEAKLEEDIITPTSTSRLATEQHGAFGETKETGAKEDPGRQEEPAATATSASTSNPDPTTAPSQDNPTAAERPHSRSLAWRNFEQALKEITPSASESLGSLTELRKWNDEFGEGRKAKKLVWGKDRFGFTLPTLDVDAAKAEPGVAAPMPVTTTTTAPSTAHSNTGLEH